MSIAYIEIIILFLHTLRRLYNDEKQSAYKGMVSVFCCTICRDFLGLFLESFVVNFLQLTLVVNFL